MTDLFPAIKPYATWQFPVGDGHMLYVEECGRGAGVPVVLLHGGPGAGSEPFHRRFFDPGRFRIVLFDQRGCGRSTPHASLDANTTGDLVNDMERIRHHLRIDRWLLFGGGWGATLALLYAERHPGRVLGMILHGVFLCRHRDVRWFLQEGANRLLPDYWEDFVAPIPPSERHEMLAAYYRRLTGSDEVGRMGAAKAWARWQARASTLLPQPAVLEHQQDPFVSLGLARIAAHYLIHGAFIEDGQILRDAEKLAGISGVIVHGRYDMICPMDAAWTLHKAWPSSEFVGVSDAGHAASETGVRAALVRSAAEFGRILG